MKSPTFGYGTYGQVAGILLGKGYCEDPERINVFWNDRTGTFAEIEKLPNGRYHPREWKA